MSDSMSPVPACGERTRTRSECRAIRTRAAWRNARQDAIERDGGVCRACGSPESWKPYVLLEVHHVIPLSEGGEPYELSNLVTVCAPCHRGIEAGVVSVEEVT